MSSQVEVLLPNTSSSEEQQETALKRKTFGDKSPVLQERYFVPVQQDKICLIADPPYTLRKIRSSFMRTSGAVVSA